MRYTSALRTCLFSAALSLAAIAPTFAASSAFNGDRVTMASEKSFDEVAKAVKSLVAKNGMMVMAEVDQGKMLSMTGMSLKATLFVIGNPTVGKQLFEQDHAVGLYVPLRIFVYSDQSGKTRLAYDKPSSLLSQFGNEKITMAAQMLDQKLDSLATMASH
jgi:Uncharacterized conserved protein